MSHDEILQIYKEVAKIAGESGAKLALETLEKEKRKMVRERRDRRLRNTKLLLKNYRMLKAHCENAVFEASQLDSSVNILDLMESVFDGEDLYVESVKRSAERTYLIINHIDEMLRLYEIYCFTSDKPEDQRRYNTLYAMYIGEEVATAQDIATKENIDIRTVYKDIDGATEKLTALIFGIDGLYVTK